MYLLKLYQEISPYSGYKSFFWYISKMQWKLNFSAIFKLFYLQWILCFIYTLDVILNVTGNSLVFLPNFQVESIPLIKPIKVGYSQLSKWLSWSTQAGSIFSSFYKDLVKCQTKVCLQILYCTGHYSFLPGKSR